MFFLNLSALEFFSLLGVLSGVISLLYLLDRSKRRKVVSTLRFWTAARSTAGQKNRTRVRDWWSFVLQLASLLLLLLAIAQLQWGNRSGMGKDHILLLDSSAWSTESDGNGADRLIDREKELARRFVAGLAREDRVLVAQVSSIASPESSLTNNRPVVLKAIDRIQPDSSALDLDQMFEFARQTQSKESNAASEIVYVGPGLAGRESTAKQPNPLRLIPVTAQTGNVGITQVSVMREPRKDGWDASVTARNYGTSDKTVVLESEFGTTHFAPKLVNLPAGQETSADIHFITTGQGQFRARINPNDALPMDNTASIHLPDAAEFQIALFTNRPEVWRPLMEANTRVAAAFYPVNAYNAGTRADVVVLDGFSPSAPPELPSIWIDPPRDRTPLPIKATVHNQPIVVWHEDAGIAAGLHGREMRLPTANIFEAFAGDVPVASVAAGDVIVTRGKTKKQPALAVVGFDPLAGALRYQVATPLLLSRLLAWLAPEERRQTEFLSLPVGYTSVKLDGGEDAANIRVFDERGANVPYTLHGTSLNLFVSHPSIISVMTNARERLLSLTLPDVGAYSWKPDGVERGMPPRAYFNPPAHDLWKSLAMAAAVCLLAEWWWFGRKRKTARKIPLILKIAGFSAIAVALFAPHLNLPGTRTAAIVLVDTSSSIPPQDLEKASRMIGEMSRQRGTNWMRVMPFSAHARELQHGELENGARLVSASQVNRDTTNFEAAISDSLSSMPDGYSPRLVLISDGNDNQGSTARAIASLQQLHIPIDTIPLGGRVANGLRLTSVSMPRTAYSGEQIPIDIRLTAASPAIASVTLTAERRSLGSTEVALEAGENNIRMRARLNTTGAVAIQGDVNGLKFEQAVTLSRAKVLMVSGNSLESDQNLMKALSEADFNVTRENGVATLNLAGSQLLILNNIDLSAIPDAKKREIAEYVRQGGGLLLIGGERQVYKEDSKLDALDEALPAKLAPPKTPEGVCVALIIDKSSSMEGRKIELARLSAIGVVEHLRPIDSIGVLIFDNSFQWAVPMRKAEDKALIKRLINGIVPDGGTQIAPALAEAYRKVESSNASYKHIVLMTDGISEEGDSIDLAKHAAEHQITISTVGLGQDVNSAYLEKVAEVSGGKSYFLNEPQGLEQILLKDVRDFSGSTAVEKSLTPIVDTKAEVLEGTDFQSAPSLMGYARFIAKPNADPILSIDNAKKDPLYVRWQFGLGRSAVFTSDAKSRWAQAWMNWPGYDRFWINVSRDLLPHARPSDADASFDPANGDLVVRYSVAPGAKLDSVPALFVLGPDGFEKPLDLKQTGKREFRGRVHIGDRTGLFRVRTMQESSAFPETGFYRQNQESNDFGTNEVLLKQMAHLTGGRYNPNPAAVFDVPGEPIYRDWQLWPLLLGVAIALTILELVARKWSGLTAGLKMHHGFEMVGLRK